MRKVETKAVSQGLLQVVGRVSILEDAYLAQQQVCPVMMCSKRGLEEESWVGRVWLVLVLLSLPCSYL